tara:strand:+ start:877 stop:1053 length:177 start_codon:yes stop_codon:yes gene_type:complete
MKNWLKVGLFWGVFMFILMAFIFPYFSNENITMRLVLMKFVFWTFGGLIYGFVTNKKS